MTDNINNNEFENNENKTTSDNENRPEQNMMGEEVAVPTDFEETQAENSSEAGQVVFDENIKTAFEVEEEQPTEDPKSAPETVCYEWKGEELEKLVKSKTKKKEHKSGFGFRAFVIAVLCVFTISFIALSAMVAFFVISGNVDKNSISASMDIPSIFNNKDHSGNKTDGKVSVNVSIPASSSNGSPYVAFDAKENEGKVLSIPQIAAKCTPSSVGVVSEVPVNYSFGFGFSQSGTSKATGSGFIFSEQGYIITNHHVIENATKVTVILNDKTELEAEIVGSDSLSDIAVLKVAPQESITLVPMELGNSDDLVVGESVVAIGCPAGIEFMGTVTDGIISSINRDVEITDNYGKVEKTMTLIQTNATINHGNSGGPLINTKGQVIGINTLKLTANYEGIGFSIPINGAVNIIAQLIEHGEVVERTDEDFAYTQGIIGITGAEISKDEADYYDIPRGVLVMQINKGSSAAKAGLKRGDIITHYNGVEVHSVSDINQQKGTARAGESVTLTVYQGEKEIVDITFKLDAQSY